MNFTAHISASPRQTHPSTDCNSRLDDATSSRRTRAVVSTHPPVPKRTPATMRPRNTPSRRTSVLSHQVKSSVPRDVMFLREPQQYGTTDNHETPPCSLSQLAPRILANERKPLAGHRRQPLAVTPSTPTTFLCI